MLAALTTIALLWYTTGFVAVVMSSYNNQVEVFPFVWVGLCFTSSYQEPGYGKVVVFNVWLPFMERPILNLFVKIQNPFFGEELIP